MRKRSWGRLGAAVGAVALLVGGLVGVSAPAQAASVEVNGVSYTISDYGLTGTGIYGVGPIDGFVREDCKAAVMQHIKGTEQDSWTDLRWVSDDMPGQCHAIAQPGSAVEPPTPQECEANGQVLNDEGTACRDRTAEETCEESGKYWYDDSCNEKSPSENQCSLDGDVWEDGECREWEELVSLPGDSQGIGSLELEVEVEGETVTVPELNSNTPEENIWVPGDDGDSPPAGYVPNVRMGPNGPELVYVLDSSVVAEPVQKNPPPPPCWDPSLNNCPVGGALRFVAPEYAMVGVPVTMYAYASWRPDANSPAQPTNGTAVIRVDGEDYSGVEFKDGIAEWRFIPETEGMKEFTASGVVFSGLSGANAYIDTVPARTYVLEYDPAAYATALKKKRVEVGDTYVITDPNQARSYLEDRYEWSVSDKSDDVCAVYETKKGAVKAKFNGEGKCTVIWMDKESEEEGKYTFIAKK